VSYIGEWKAGKMHGKGEYMKGQKKTYREYKNGVKVEEISSEAGKVRGWNKGIKRTKTASKF